MSNAQFALIEDQRYGTHKRKYSNSVHIINENIWYTSLHLQKFPVSKKPHFYLKCTLYSSYFHLPTD